MEKGYARFVGPRTLDAAWAARARGWIRVMHLDIACSMAIYTLATVAFYLLGAGVLHRMGVVPAARDTVAVLSQIYTQTLGGWALWVFYVGVVVTLYGTIFAATAAHSRMMADLVRVLGVYRARRCRERGSAGATASSSCSRRCRRVFFWLFESPVRMVVAGGVAQALMLPLIGFAAIYVRHRACRASCSRRSSPRSRCGSRPRSCSASRLLRLVDTLTRLRRATAAARKRITKTTKCTKNK